MKPLLESRNLDIGYGGTSSKEAVYVARNLDLRLHSGQMVCLLGPNGAGKSTLIRTLCGIQRPLGGSISLSNIPLETITPLELARQMAVVLTDKVAVDYLAVQDLVALGRYPYTNWTGKLKEADWLIVDEMIRLLGLEKLKYREIADLSDGEKQKSMIARALAQQPLMICLDEPTAFLDLPRKIELLSNLRKLSRETGRTFLLSIHDLELALGSADLLWILDGENHFYRGTPEDLVLDGCISRVFDTSEVRFDESSGTFRRDRKGVERIQVLESTYRREGLWTIRALERIGFEPVKTSASLVVEIVQKEQKPNWNLKAGSTSYEFFRLGELIAHLESTHSLPS